MDKSKHGKTAPPEPKITKERPTDHSNGSSGTTGILEILTSVRIVSEQWIRGLSITRDGIRIAFCGADKLIRVYRIDQDPKEGVNVQLERTFAGHEGEINAVCWMPNGRSLVSASDDRTLIIWGLAIAQKPVVLLGHLNYVYAVDVSQDGRYIVSAGYDKTVRIWNAHKGFCISVLNGHTDIVLSVCISSDNKWIYSGSTDTTLRRWPVQSRSTSEVIQTHEDNAVTCVCASPDGKRLVAGTYVPVLAQYNTDSFSRYANLKGQDGSGHVDKVRACRFSQDGLKVLTCAEDGKVILWEAASGKVLMKFVGHTGKAWCCDFVEKAGIVAAGSEDGSVLIWKIPKKKKVRAAAASSAPAPAASSEAASSKAMAEKQEKIHAPLPKRTITPPSVTEEPVQGIVSSSPQEDESCSEQIDSGTAAAPTVAPVVAAALRASEASPSTKEPVSIAPAPVEKAVDPAPIPSQRTVVVSSTDAGDAPAPATTSGESITPPPKAKKKLLAEMNVEEVGEWLEEIGFGEFSKAFVDNDVEGASLIRLSEENLKELGVSKVGPRKRLQGLIEEAKVTSASSSSATTSSPSSSPSTSATTTRVFTSKDPWTPPTLPPGVEWKDDGQLQSVCMFPRNESSFTSEIIGIRQLLNEQLHGNGKFDFEEIHAINNKRLLSAFDSRLQLMHTRLSEEPATFMKRTWEGKAGEEWRAWMMERLSTFALQFKNNANRAGTQLFVIPVVHGTSVERAWSIAKTGFASMALNDAGYFGRGVYFTTHVPYAWRFACFNNPGPKALILSWVIMGNTLPVIEFPHDVTKGGPLLTKKKYEKKIMEEQKPSRFAGPIIGDSHFTVVRPFKGSSIAFVPCRESEAAENSKRGELFDEVIVNQEASIVPTHIIFINQR